MIAPEERAPTAPLIVKALRVQGFKGIRELCLPLSPSTTFLIGENNTGKTSVLEALASVLGGRTSSEEDLHLNAESERAESFVVDVSLIPKEGDAFHEDLTAILGNAVQRMHDGSEYAAIRFRCSPSPERTGLTLSRNFLSGWRDCTDDPAAARELAQPPVGTPSLDLLSFWLLDARRDIAEELRNRRSAWGRLVADLDVDPALLQELEAALRDLGNRIVDGSDVLSSVHEELASIRRALGSSVAEIQLSPLPPRLPEVARAIDVLVRAPGAAAIPMRLQGMGSRSLAALVIFQAFVDIRLGAGRAVRPHAVSAFEEPEAHLHPQAQRAVIRLLGEVLGQKIVSTHSPQVASVADIASIRVFGRHGPELGVRHVTSGLSPEEEYEIASRVLSRHPEVLFARLVVILEGHSEDGAVPVFARAYWGGEPPEGRGMTFVNAESLGQAKPLVRVLEDLEIPWLILADGDQAGESAVRGIGNRIGRELNRDSAEVVMLPEDLDFEAFLLAQGFRTQLEEAIASFYGENALESFKRSREGQRGYASAGWEERLVHDFLDDNKSSYGPSVAKAILERPLAEGESATPGMIQELFERADRILGGTQ